MTDTLAREERSERMSCVKSCDTKPELRLRRLVWNLGYRCRKNRNDILGKPDLAFIGRKRAIFLHGRYWHRHDCPSGQRTPKSRRTFWNEKFRKNIERDAVVMKGLREGGWRALVVWECEFADTCRVQRKVGRFLDA